MHRQLVISREKDGREFGHRPGYTNPSDTECMGVQRRVRSPSDRRTQRQKTAVSGRPVRNKGWLNTARQ